MEVSLCQGCVMSPWLFNLFMDGVIKEIRETASDMGVRLILIEVNMNELLNG